MPVNIINPPGGGGGGVSSVNGDTGPAVVIDKTDIGLSNADNTSDADKPVSTAQQTALNLKADAADISNIDNTSDLDKPVSTAQQTALDGKADDQPAEFGSSDTVNTNYIASRGFGVIANNYGLLGNNYNFTNFTYLREPTPNFPGVFMLSGHYGGVTSSDETFAVDPNRVYKLTAYVNQQSKAGFGAFTNGERHQQYIGITEFDVDGLQISSRGHMYNSNTYTTLAAPLTPGDPTMTVADASSWENASSNHRRAIRIFEYKNSFGAKYDFYTRYQQDNFWAPGGVNAGTGVITLTAPFPIALQNPDDISGTWPIGTRVANGRAGGLKYSFIANFIPPAADTWYRTTSWIGGVDTSGANTRRNFSPGTALVNVFVLGNFSNRLGGHTSGPTTYPDTGADHEVYFAGFDIQPDVTAELEESVTGFKDIYRLSLNTGTGAVTNVVVPTNGTAEEV